MRARGSGGGTLRVAGAGTAEPPRGSGGMALEGAARPGGGGAGSAPRGGGMAIGIEARAPGGGGRRPGGGSAAPGRAGGGTGADGRPARAAKLLPARTRAAGESPRPRGRDRASAIPP